MTMPLVPVVFAPICKAKPWGGRSLEQLFGKALPTELLIGESWELADLPGVVSRVSRGPLAGETITNLMRMWGRELLGSAAEHAGRFPLLIKFLDARERLSLQVHPRPRIAEGAALGPSSKEEAWYVVDAAPNARMYVGLRRTEHDPAGGTTPELQRELSRRLQELLENRSKSESIDANLLDILHERTAKRGDCFYLPSGIPHALGGGFVICEIQTPVDVTYRLYDWGRVGTDGMPRRLHVCEALQNIRFDVRESEIVQPVQSCPGVNEFRERLMTCRSFFVERVRMDAGKPLSTLEGEMRVWIPLDDEIVLEAGGLTQRFAAGEVILLPAGMARGQATCDKVCRLLDVGVPSSKSCSGARP